MDTRGAVNQSNLRRIGTGRTLRWRIVERHEMAFGRRLAEVVASKRGGDFFSAVGLMAETPSSLDLGGGGPP